MAHVQARGINLHYLQVGSGPHMVMLHGLTGNQAVWHLKMVPLMRQAFRITTYDLRGHGRSDLTPTGYTTDNMAEDLLALMDTLEIPQADLVGHSLGADIALHFALHHPKRVRRLVLVEAGIPALAMERKNPEWEGWAYWAKMLEEFTGVAVPRKQDRTLRLIEETTIIQDYDVIGDLTLENLATIPHRKFLAYDQSSPYLGTYQTLSEILTNCTPVLLPATKYRHFGPLEAPDLLVEQILRFLDPAAIDRGGSLAAEVSWSAT